MKKLTTSAVLAACALLSACATPDLPPSAAGESANDPAAQKAALQTQARGLRDKILQLKQETLVFEVMLTDVERRAAMAQIPLSSLPNTSASAVAEAAPVPARRDADRLSVTARAVPAPLRAVKPLPRKGKSPRRAN